MTTFDKRENAFETEFAHQEELKFRAREKAVMSLAVWAAGQLGKTGEAIQPFVREMIDIDIASPTIEPTIDRIAEVLAAKGISKDEIRQMMGRFMAAAEAAVRSTLPPSR